MTYNDKQVKALANMEEAIADLNIAFDNFAENEVTTGWVLVISGYGMAEPDPEGDPMEMKAVYAFHSRRGQDPTMTRGIVEEFRDIIRSNGAEQE